MSTWPINWSGLTERQKKAIEGLLEDQKSRLFIGTFPQQIAESFRESNRLQESASQEERERGERFERALLEQCGHDPR